MYPLLLSLHSLFRWLVLISLVSVIGRAYFGWLCKKPFSKTDNAIRHWTATIAHIQLVFGLCLYAICPVVRYFLNNYSEAVHNRQIRFFGMEHSSVMLVAIIVITIGSAKAKRKTTDREKLRPWQYGTA